MSAKVAYREVAGECDLYTDKRTDESFLSVYWLQSSLEREEFGLLHQYERNVQPRLRVPIETIGTVFNAAFIAL